jgi:hypothetical protein
MKIEKDRHSEKVVTHVPPAVAQTLTEVASRRMQSRAEYVRQAIVSQLERDGVCLVAA